jgi:hypothetical protein
MSALNADYKKRDCSLPPGCKDLIDVLKLETAKQAKLPWIGVAPSAGAASHPQRTRVQIGSHVTVKQLAVVLGRNTFEIVADGPH